MDLVSLVSKPTSSGWTSFDVCATAIDGLDSRISSLSVGNRVPGGLKFHFSGSRDFRATTRQVAVHSASYGDSAANSVLTPNHGVVSTAAPFSDSVCQSRQADRSITSNATDELPFSASTPPTSGNQMPVLHDLVDLSHSSAHRSPSLPTGGSLETPTKESYGQETLGLENLPLHRGVFFMASNHLSHLDCGATFMAAWAGGVRRVYALGARDYFFKSPLKAWFVTSCMNVIPFSRRGFSQQEIEVLLRVKEASSQERPTAILIFPEGTRSVTGSLQTFKAGVGLLAEQLDIPVVPVCVKGTLDALPKGKVIPYRHKIRVEFGQPLEFSEFATQYRSGLKEDQEISLPPEHECRETLEQQQQSAVSSHQCSDVERRVRRETQKKFAECLRSAVLMMLRGYGQGRVPRVPGTPEHHLPLAQRLGGGKWNLLGWLLYWLPMSCCMVLAVVLAATQVYRTGSGMAVAGRLGIGTGYAAAAGVFGGLQGAGINGKVFVVLGIILVAFYLRDFIHWLWPYVVLDSRDD